jgi:hypothetical protein
MNYCDFVLVTTLHVTGQPYTESARSFASQSATVHAVSRVGVTRTTN